MHVIISSSGRMTHVYACAMYPYAGQQPEVAAKDSSATKYPKVYNGHTRDDVLPIVTLDDPVPIVTDFDVDASEKTIAAI